MVKKRVTTIFDSKTYTFNLFLDFSKDLTSISQKITLVECDNPTEKEQELIDKQTPLYNHSRQWLNGVENDSYIALCHSQLLESIRRFPGAYLVDKLKLPHDQRFIPTY